MNSMDREVARLENKNHRRAENEMRRCKVHSCKVSSKDECEAWTQGEEFKWEIAIILGRAR